MLVRKLEAACHQLDWAIRLLLDHDQPIPAITLASAAEELLGRAVGDDSAHEDLVKSFMESHGLDRRTISQAHLNRAKNWLKHWNFPEEPAELELDLENEAIIAITRAMYNLLQFNQSFPSEGERFLTWAVAQRAVGPN